MKPPRPDAPHRRGRAASSNAVGRYEAWQREACDDGWVGAEAPAHAVPTELTFDSSRSLISCNDSPDVPFAQSANPYRGCEHGCIYCYARPSHAYLGYSPGLDFETRLVAKPAAAELLRRELARPGYRCQPLALCGNTDGWQPIERPLRLTRALLEVLAECRHPVGIVSKAALIERDLDLLTGLARDGLVHVAISLTTLDATLARRLEPRAASPQRRLATIRRLSEAGVPVGVMIAPILPGLTDHELESLLTAARKAGARYANWQLLRLPLEVVDLFREWLAVHYPERAARVLGLIAEMRGGALNDRRFRERMRGEGPLADLLRQRFHLACRRLGLNPDWPELRCDLFRPPALRPAVTAQMQLF